MSERHNAEDVEPEIVFMLKLEANISYREKIVFFCKPNNLLAT